MWGLRPGVSVESPDPVPTQAYALPCDQVPDLNMQIVSLVRENLYRKMGRGECWDVAAIPLRAYDAKWDQRFVFGREVNYKTECVYPGDILQFENVMIESREGNSILREEMPHHTAVVYEVKAPGHYLLAHQNYNNTRKVILAEIRMENVKRGKLVIYRPEV